MLGYINDEKVVSKIKYEVLPGILEQDIEDIVKYTLVLKSFMDMSDMKAIGALLTGTIGTTCAFFLTSPVGIAAGATVAIASAVGAIKTHKDAKLYDKLFKVLLMSLDIVHGVTPEQVQAVLDKTTAEDLVDFLESQGCTTKNND